MAVISLWCPAGEGANDIKTKRLYKEKAFLYKETRIEFHGERREDVNVPESSKKKKSAVKKVKGARKSAQTRGLCFLERSTLSLLLLRRKFMTRDP